MVQKRRKLTLLLCTRKDNVIDELIMWRKLECVGINSVLLVPRPSQSSRSDKGRCLGMNGKNKAGTLVSLAMEVFIVMTCGLSSRYKIWRYICF